MAKHMSNVEKWIALAILVLVWKSLPFQGENFCCFAGNVLNNFSKCLLEVRVISEVFKWDIFVFNVFKVLLNHLFKLFKLVITYNDQIHNIGAVLFLKVGSKSLAQSCLFFFAFKG